jgi:hypothetical protein
MMGGGGSYTPAFGKGQEEIARREAEAKRELAKATAVRRNLFISFAAEDINAVNALRAQAKNENSEIEFIDRSVSGNVLTGRERRSGAHRTRPALCHRRRDQRIRGGGAAVQPLKRPESPWSRAAQLSNLSQIHTDVFGCS